MLRTHSFTLMIAMAYFAMAFVSIFTDIPSGLTNNLSLGAVLFSVSELIEVCNNRLIKSRSVVDIVKDDICKDKYGFALLYIREILKEKNSKLKKEQLNNNDIELFFKKLFIYVHNCIPVCFYFF